MRRTATIGVFAWLVLSGVAFAQMRSELPVHEVVLSDHTRRYTVPIKVGDTAIEAGLDTGSTGLRVLPDTLQGSDAKSLGGNDAYSYDSGTSVEGQTGTATITIGQLSGSSTLQLIKNVRCTEEKPNCPASHVALAQFGIQGDGLPGEGFRAILGVNMGDADLQNPLSAIGVKRWIIVLPRRSGETGKLVLNPNQDETKDFTLLPVIPAFRGVKGGGLHDAVSGCIFSDGIGAKACGPLLSDTGAPGILVINRGLGETVWPNGSAATLVFFSGDAPVAMEKFAVGMVEHASHLSIGHEEHRPGAIYAGLSPYFAFEVLYDPEKAVIGLRPRAPELTSPVGVILDRRASHT